MPFLLIRGTFRVVTKNSKGQPIGLQPDGDSIHFRPDNPDLLDKLKHGATSYRLSRIGSLNLRLEGIDALELHYAGARQPRPLPERARDRLLDLVGIDRVTYGDDGVTVKPPVPGDAQPGWILSKQLDVHGRPVSFAFARSPSNGDGAWIRLAPALLRKSLNHRLLKSGVVFPLFYDTLYADLRRELAIAANAARRAGKGVWAHSPTRLAPAGDLAVIESRSVLYPKLFRRLVDFFRDRNGELADLPGWMDARNENDDVMLLSRDSNWTHFDDVLRIEGERIALRYQPTDLVFGAR